ncbi:MAG: hypothetical protein JWP03_1388 [Phycisphaerales bacterium]|nr:hypothetical protein [Phycisphaerales bacterium]
MQPLEYQSSRTHDFALAKARIAWWIFGVAIAVVGANFWLVYPAAADRSWGAINVLLFKGPTTNLCILVTSLVLTPVVRHYSRGAAVMPYVLTCVFAPIAAVVFDSIYILSMNLHGC